MGFLSFQDSGIIIERALGMSFPDIVRNSNTLSRVALSLMPGCITGRMSFMSGISGDPIIPSRACIQDLLALMVFISPLWQSILKGCASFQAGIVLVLNLEWTMATADWKSGSERSG